MAGRRLFLIRHGPTHQTAFTGWRDVPADLSDTAKIARLSAFLPEAPVISSDLSRAVATADAIQGPRPRLPHDADLREFHFGVWDGMEFSAVAARDPELSRAFWEEPGDIAPPEGEGWNTVTLRTGAAIDRAWQSAEGDLIVVAHFGVILCHMAAATGMDPYEALGYQIEPLSVTVLETGEKTWRADRISFEP